MQRSNLYLIAILMLISGTNIAQEIQKPLDSFSRVIVSPKINLVLTHGDEEEIQLVYSGVDKEKINIDVRHNTLRVYLDDSRIIEKQRRISNRKESLYRDANITAYVTFKQLKHLEIRGNQQITCDKLIQEKKLTIKAYGENEIKIDVLKTEYLKTVFYGENRLSIASGKTYYQKYKLYGENRIDTRDVKNFNTTATIYGESKIRIYSQDQLRINAFGEADVAYNGDADLNKGLLFGRSKIRKLD